jgi:hypothetical protein
MSTEFVLQLTQKIKINYNILRKKNEIIKKMATSTKSWATDAQALANSLLFSYHITIPAPTEFKKIQKFIKYPYSTIQGPIYSIFVR